ncbi:DUF4232 domain-containing protein [Streptomyces sp. NPDC048664]|uniref:DUF4232 domain-containing protein n=1 Tax=Streptomyces sp. NPDC048664 TaxID=3154505 RepID=UPI00343DF553
MHRTTATLLAACATGCLLASAGAAAADTGTGRGAASVAPCTSARITAEGAHRTASGQVVVTVVNRGPGSCVLRGHPTVALAGQGAPQANTPLSVVRQGTAKPVLLAVGGRAVTRLTFTPVLGEASGYCASGADPVVAPSIVVGVAGGGQQLAPDDGGEFALCGRDVAATAFQPVGS